ncbi:hypothetical protein [Pseudochryseolinea flava]|uniref:Uncharacterized protein n=1 Tax=Pseudochryseolinea flava TaxID=2059302 RepID=A0A364Y1I3_9BACT|nr:hypothetical protein [Pseudochryseolinea flava]RAW00490.1 hypothetical protein DQQ10_12865 [Pseudochryseolinea flava]
MQAKLYNAHQKLVQAMEEFNAQHYRVYGRILRDEEPIRKLIRITQESQTEMVVVDAVKKLGERFTDKETGLPVLETIEPAHTVGKTTWMDPEVKLNEFFYMSNRFPVVDAKGMAQV